MDKQVELAMAKWPDVPDCYGWLALDARGNWRMRDQRCQQLGLPGSKIGNLALREFINRNYLADPQGRYFFQNGPQRVFVELEATPYIAHAEPQQRWVLHTGVVLEQIDAVWVLPEGTLILGRDSYLAQIDDRDMAEALAQLHWQGQPASDTTIIDWLSQPTPGMTFCTGAAMLPVLPFLPDQQHYVRSPAASVPQTSSR